MWKKRDTLIVVLGVLILVVLMWVAVVSRPREPIYQGKPFGAWLDQYRTNFSVSRDPQKRARQEEAETAIRQIGTNALPALLRMVHSKDSPLKRKAMALAGKQHIFKLSLYSADYYQAKASYGFGILGPAAKPLVPALIGVLQDNDESVKASAVHSLGFIGPAAVDAVPSLINLLNDRNQTHLILESMSALGSIGKKPEIVVPLLMEFVNGPRQEWNCAVPALGALRRFGVKAKAASPVLQGLLTDPDINVRNAALNALNRIDPDSINNGRAK